MKIDKRFLLISMLGFIAVISLFSQGVEIIQGSIFFGILVIGTSALGLIISTVFFISSFQPLQREEMYTYSSYVNLRTNFIKGISFALLVYWTIFIWSVFFYSFRDLLIFMVAGIISSTALPLTGYLSLKNYKKCLLDHGKWDGHETETKGAP